MSSLNPASASLNAFSSSSKNTSGEDLWSVEGIEVVSTSLESEGEFKYYVITCRSFHLTGFGVLMDVYGVTDVTLHDALVLRFTIVILY